MKNLILIFAILVSSNSFAGRRTKFFSHTIKAQTEEKVLELAKDAFPKIKNGEIKSVFQGDCRNSRPDDIKINSLTIRKVYNVVNDTELKTSYLGYIRYRVKNCID